MGYDQSKETTFFPEHCILPSIGELLNYVCAFSSPLELPDYSTLRAIFEHLDMSDDDDDDMSV